MRPGGVCYTWRDAHILEGDNNYEILDGDLLPTSLPDVYHRRVADNLRLDLRRQINRLDWGKVYRHPYCIVLNKTTLVSPDLFLLHKSRLGIIQGRKALGAPEIVIEIDSEKSREEDLMTRRRLYARHGVREYWLLSPLTHRVEVLIWSEVGYIKINSQVASERIFSPLLPMLHISLAKIFSNCIP